MIVVDGSGSVCCGREGTGLGVGAKDGDADSEKIISGGQCMDLG